MRGVSSTRVMVESICIVGSLTFLDAPLSPAAESVLDGLREL